jgi:hypothetical protein
MKLDNFKPIITNTNMKNNQENDTVEMKKNRLEELRIELREERISYGELAELQSLVEFIEESDVELLEAAGVPEF